MQHPIERREFLTGSIAAAVAVGAGSSVEASESKAKQEYYEWRVYRNSSAEKQAIVSNYLEKALVPALNRMGIDRVGVFTEMKNDKDHSIYTLISYSTLQAFSDLNAKLAADKNYLSAAGEYFALPVKDPAYTRIESRFMKAFAGMPVIEMPEESKKGKPRLFELRTYESHNEEKARLKVDMFNSGEIQIMRDVELAPVFYGEMLIGDDVPNLTYMLSAGDMESHEKHWQAFRVHPEWDRMKKLEKYKGTVSKIRKWYLQPTSYSQI